MPTKHHPTPLAVLLHTGALSGVAVAQPLYSILGQNSEFLVAHNATGTAITFLILVLSLLLPLGLTSIFVLLPARIGMAWVFLVTALLAAMASSTILHSFEAAKGWATLSIGLCVSLGIIVALAYFRWSVLRLWLAFFALGVIGFPLTFVLENSIQKLLFSDIELVDSATPARTPPIVMVVLDEINTHALLNTEQRLDETRFPNFVSLARDGTWYKNAATMQLATTQAIPAIVTGRLPYAGEVKRLPIASEYPDNLFTRLHQHYYLNVAEKVTALCSADICDPDPVMMSAMLQDVFFIYLHIIVPTDWRQNLPDISSNWSGFGTVSEPTNLQNRPDQPVAKITEKERFRRFINSIAAHPQGFHFIHSLLPHVPYIYLPSGAQYSFENHVPDGVVEERWLDNQELVDLGQERFLLQTAFVDRLLGELLQQLHSLGIYDDALIIVTADHGVSFEAMAPRRALTAKNAQDVLPIPLIVKYPGSKQGHVDERYVSNLDIVSTIADVLGTVPPWVSDGESLLSSHSRTHVLVPFPDPSRDEVFPVSRVFEFNSLARQHQVFGSGSSLDGHFRPRGHDYSMGTELLDLPRSRQAFRLDNRSRYDYVDISAGIVPALITGEVLGSGDTSLDVDILVNGLLRAVTTTTTYKERLQYFAAMVPASAFKVGANAIDLALISSEPPGNVRFTLLQDMALQMASAFTLKLDGQGKPFLVDPLGTEFPKSSELRGLFENVTRKRDRLFFSGWSGNVGTNEPADAVFLLRDDKVLAVAPLNRPRKDVARAFSQDRLLSTGFSIEIPAIVLKDLVDTDTIRVVTRSGDKFKILKVNPNVIAKLRGLLESSLQED